MLSIIITGAPGSGKTTIARHLSRKLPSFQCFGTDIIREVARTFVSKEKFPWFHSSAVIADQYAPNGVDKVVWAYQSQSKLVNPCVNAIINRYRTENQNVILEGATLICKIGKEAADHDSIKIVLNVSDEDQHYKQLLEQSELRSSYKSANFKKIRHLQEYFVSEAEKNNIIVIENKSIRNTVGQILKLAIHMMKEQKRASK